MATGQKSKKKTVHPVWTVQGLERRCQQIIQSGKLAHEGPEAVVAAVNAEMSEKLEAKQKGLRLTLRQFQKHLPSLIWTKLVLDELRNSIRHNIPLERFTSLHPWIPERLLQEKSKRLTGANEATATARFIAGMGRLSTKDLPPEAELFEFPSSTFRDPYVIELTDEKGRRLDEWTHAIVNGANLGLKYDRLIEENWVRRALSDAEKRGDKFVILTNCINLDTTKAAGPLKVYKAQVSGLKTNIEFLPESYRAEAKRLLHDRPVDQVLCEALESRFENLMTAGWGIIAQRPDDKGPEFTGRVVVIFGYQEESVINAAAYNECRYAILQKRRALEFEMAMVRRRMRDEDEDEDELREEYEALGQQLALTIISNVTDEDYERHRRRMRYHVVHKFQEVIPNCTVISQGSAVLKVNGEMLEINIPGHLSVTDGLLASYVDEFGAKVFRDAVPRTAVICHPYALNHRLVGRDDSRGNQRSTSMVHVAPIVVDEVFLRKLLNDATRAVHPIMRVLRNEQFRSGVLVFHHANGVTNVDSHPVAKLDESRGCQGNLAVYPYPETKYIIIAIMTDWHFGGRSREHIRVPYKREYVGVVEGAIELMRHEGLIGPDMPVHLVTVNDDPVQGNHFGTHLQPDPTEIPYPELEKMWRKRQEEFGVLAKAGDSAGMLKMVDDLAASNLSQFLIRGLDWVQPQMLEVYSRHIEPCLDFYDAVLRRVIKSKINIKGVSEHRGIPYDARDAGAINIGTGNHFEASVERMLTESPFYVKHLQATLLQKPYWQARRDLINKLVRAPLYSNDYFAWGTVRAPGEGAYEWGINFTSSPARLSSWSDPLAAVVNNDRARGDATYFLKGKVMVRIFGDKHFTAGVEVPYGIYAMAAASTHTDLYGERGFPPNNTGVMFLCLPAGGPDDGPVLYRPLHYDVLRDWFAKPRPFNFKKFFPRAV